MSIRPFGSKAPPGWSRRRLLQAGLTLPLLGWPWACGTATPPRRSSLELLGKAVEEVDLPLPVGGAYLWEREANPPGLEDLGETLSRQVEELGPRSWFRRASMSQRDLMGILGRLIRSDFEEGRVEVLEGWHLSRTECRLAAIRYWNHLVPGEGQVGEALYPDLPRIRLLEVQDWGPRDFFRGDPGLEQGIWIETAGPIPAQLNLSLGGTALQTTREEGLLRGSLPPGGAEGPARPGSYPVYLLETGGAGVQPIGLARFWLSSREGEGLQSFRIRELWKVVDWGPKVIGREHTRFRLRVQPGGLEHVVVYAGEMRLVTRVRPTSITASFRPAQIEELLQNPGDHALHLCEPGRRIKQFVGNFQVPRP